MVSTNRKELPLDATPDVFARANALASEFAAGPPGTTAMRAFRSRISTHCRKRDYWR